MKESNVRDRRTKSRDRRRLVVIIAMYFLLLAIIVLVYLFSHKNHHIQKYAKSYLPDPPVYSRIFTRHPDVTPYPSAKTRNVLKIYEKDNK